MKKKYTKEQIINILAKVESGIPLGEVVRKYGISTASYYKWKAKFGGMHISEARRLKSLEEENSKALLLIKL